MDKLSFETLESMLADAIQLVPPGSHWRPYKGNDYRVEQLVIQESDNQVAVGIIHPSNASKLLLLESLDNSHLRVCPTVKIRFTVATICADEF